MARWNPPNTLLYLGALLRPSALRPDLRVPTIGHVDWVALRDKGFNAVVVDKDNCLTLPESDELHTPLQAGWSSLLAAFPPGRVLIVSNSAGTARKDPSGVAAESVSLSLRAPVLLHTRPKPGCAQDILDYFRTPSSSTSSTPNGTSTSPPPSSNRPTTLRARIAQRHRAALQEEKEDVARLVDHFDGLVHGPVMRQRKQSWLADSRIEGRDQGGERPDASAGRIFGRSFVGGEDESMARTVEVEKESASGLAGSAPLPAKALVSGSGARTNENDDSAVEATQQHPPIPHIATPRAESLRIVVLGDRLFTDTLLASRLRAFLPSSTAGSSTSTHRSEQDDRVISIHTSRLPQPADVRLLRRLESLLTRDRLRPSRIDWGRYALPDETALSAELAAQERRDWRRFLPFREAYLAAPALGWHPRTWRAVTLFVGAGRATRYATLLLVDAVRRGLRWSWAKGKLWYSQRQIAREQTEQTKAAAVADMGATPKEARTD